MWLLATVLRPARRSCGPSTPCVKRMGFDKFNSTRRSEACASSSMRRASNRGMLPGFCVERESMCESHWRWPKTLGELEKDKTKGVLGGGLKLQGAPKKTSGRSY